MGTTFTIFLEVERVFVHDLALLGKGSWFLRVGKVAAWEGSLLGMVERL